MIVVIDRCRSTMDVVVLWYADSSGSWLWLLSMVGHWTVILTQHCQFQSKYALPIPHTSKPCQLSSAKNVLPCSTMWISFCKVHCCPQCFATVATYCDPQCRNVVAITLLPSIVTPAFACYRSTNYSAVPVNLRTCIIIIILFFLTMQSSWSQSQPSSDSAALPSVYTVKWRKRRRKEKKKNNNLMLFW